MRSSPAALGARSPAALGARVVYGDSAIPSPCAHTQVETAERVISAAPDELLRGTSNAARVRPVRAIAANSMVFACASRPARKKARLAAGAGYVFTPAAETTHGVRDATAAARTGQLDAFRSARDGVCDH